MNSIILLTATGFDSAHALSIDILPLIPILLIVFTFMVLGFLFLLIIKTGSSNANEDHRTTKQNNDFPQETISDQPIFSDNHKENLIEYKNGSVLYKTNDLFRIIGNINCFNKISIGEELFFKTENENIAVYQSNVFLTFLPEGSLFDVVKDFLNNGQYTYKCTIIGVKNDDTIAISLIIYRIINIDNDPFVIKNDFNLIKTTKKDNGKSRQNSYFNTRERETLDLRERGDSIVVFNVHNQILGELSSKATEYVYSHNINKCVCKLISKTMTESGHIVGTIRIYEITR